MHRKPAAALALAALTLTLAGCSAYQSTDSVTNNKTTIADAESMYGEPSKKRYGADGSETWTWDSNNMSIKFMDGVAIDSWAN